MNVRPLVLAALALALAAPQALAAGAKATQTPAFCQTDPTAGFKGSGENYCAPTALSDALLYLAGARHFDKLAKGDHDGHAKLIRALAKHMGTDPANGTGPAGIMKGLWTYVESKHYHVAKLEYAGWRDIGKANMRFAKSKQVPLPWLTAAANDPDAGVLLNVGWYKQAPGGYQRTGGHWVAVVGAGKADLQLRNPSKPEDKQATANTVALTALGPTFKIVKSPGAPATLAGYYQASGPGIPTGATTKAVVDCAMVFSLKN